METTIETMTSGNIPLLRNVAGGVFENAIDLSRLADFLDQSNHILCVAVLDALVVGQARAVLHYQPDGPPRLHIDCLRVASAFQKQGIRSRLLDALIAEGRAQTDIQPESHLASDDPDVISLFQKDAREQGGPAHWFEQ